MAREEKSRFDASSCSMKAVTAVQAKSIQNQLSRGLSVRCVSSESLSVPIDDLVLFDSPDHGWHLQSLSRQSLC